MFDFIGKICLVVALFLAGSWIGVEGITEFINSLTGR